MEKCLQQDCYQAKQERKLAKSGALENPCLRILQSGKNLKFWKNNGKLEQVDLDNYPVFACLIHSLQADCRLKEARRTEQTLIIKLTNEFGFMYSFDLFLGATNKLKMSNLCTMVRSTIKNRESASLTAQYVENALETVVTPKLDQQTQMMIEQTTMLNILTSQNLAGNLINFFETKGYKFQLLPDGNHFTATWDNMTYDSRSKVETKQFVENLSIDLEQTKSESEHATTDLLKEPKEKTQPTKLEETSNCKHQCQVCNKKYKSPKTLQCHMKTVHKKEISVPKPAPVIYAIKSYCGPFPQADIQKTRDEVQQSQDNSDKIDIIEESMETNPDQILQPVCYYLKSIGQPPKKKKNSI